MKRNKKINSAMKYATNTLAIEGYFSNNKIEREAVARRMFANELSLQEAHRQLTNKYLIRNDHEQI